MNRGLDGSQQLLPNLKGLKLTFGNVLFKLKIPFYVSINAAGHRKSYNILFFLTIIYLSFLRNISTSGLPYIKNVRLRGDVSGPD